MPAVPIVAAALVLALAAGSAATLLRYRRRRALRALTAEQRAEIIARVLERARDRTAATPAAPRPEDGRRRAPAARSR